MEKLPELLHDYNSLAVRFNMRGRLYMLGDALVLGCEEQRDAGVAQCTLCTLCSGDESVLVTIVSAMLKQLCFEKSGY